MDQQTDSALKLFGLAFGGIVASSVLMAIGVSGPVVKFALAVGVNLPFFLAVLSIPFGGLKKSALA